MVLTAGAIEAILNGCILEKPILKIINIRKVSPEGQIDKNRLFLTDGQQNYSYVVLNSALNSRVSSGEIAQDCVIRLDNYQIANQKDKKIIMISELTVIKTDEIKEIKSIGEIETKKIDKTQQIINPISNFQSLDKTKQNIKTTISNFQTIDIALLNPYQNKWSIKGCVLHKEPIKTWSNPKSDGKLFNFTMFDDSCDVKVTAFNQDVDKFFDLVTVGKTYVLSKASVKPNNRQFNKTKCDHEITLRNDSEIVEIEGDSINGPSIIYNFIDFSQLKEKSVNDCVDIIGIVHEMKEVASIVTKKTNKEIYKRDLTLVDRSGCSINMTLWANDVKCVENLVNPVIAVRGATISDFNGRSLNVGFSAMVRVNPVDMPQAEQLIGWYRSGGGSDMQFVAQSVAGGAGGGTRGTKKVTIVELACTNQGDKGDYFIVEGVIANIKKENIVYKSCGKCNKKVVDQNNGLYSCVKCEIESPDFKYRLMLNVNVLDHTGGVWMTAFQEIAERLLGMSAQAIGEMIENQAQDDVEKLISNLLYRDDINFKVRVTNDTYNDETRMKSVMVDWTLVDLNEALVTILAEL